MADPPYEQPISPTYWHVMFLSRPFQHWYDIFTPRWCRHVLMYGYVKSLDLWVWIDPAAEKTTVAVLSDADYDVVRGRLAERVSCRVLVQGGKGGFWLSRGVLTCSGALQRVIGIKGGALFPWMLYRTLLKNDGVVKEDYRDERKSQSPQRGS